MSRFTIWLHGRIMGTYPGPEEVDAFNAYAQEQGSADAKAYNKKNGLTRDDYRAKEVEDEQQPG